MLTGLLFAGLVAGCGAAQAQAPAAAAAATDVVWTDSLALGVGGRPFEANSGDATFTRFPPAAQQDVNPGEWSSGKCSTGMFVQFASNATSIPCRYTRAPAKQTVFSNLRPLGLSARGR